MHLPLTQVTIPGPPRTKKNHTRLIWCGGKPRIMPSEAYLEWEKSGLQTCTIKGPKSLAEPLNVRATIYRATLTGDAVGYYQAIGDFLQKAGVVVDDKWLVSWDGTRLDKDAASPRVELTLEGFNGIRQS